MQTARFSAVLSPVPEPRHRDRQVRQQGGRVQGAIGPEQLLAGQHHHPGESGERVGRAAVPDELSAGRHSAGDHLQQRRSEQQPEQQPEQQHEQRLPDRGQQRPLELDAERAERVDVVVQWPGAEQSVEHRPERQRSAEPAAGQSAGRIKLIELKPTMISERGAPMCAGAR